MLLTIQGHSYIGICLRKEGGNRYTSNGSIEMGPLNIETLFIYVCIKCFRTLSSLYVLRALLGKCRSVSPSIFFCSCLSMPVAMYDGCGIVAFVYWLRLKQYIVETRLHVIMKGKGETVNRKNRIILSIFFSYLPCLLKVVSKFFLDSEVHEDCPNMRQTATNCFCFNYRIYANTPRTLILGQEI